MILPTKTFVIQRGWVAYCKRLLKGSILLMLVLLTTPTLFGQTDTKFWVAVPYETPSHGGASQAAMKQLVLSSLGSPTTVTISIPANPAFTPIVVDMAANSTETVDLADYNSLIENNNWDVAADKGILIESTDFITAYLELPNPQNTDIFALKGRHALGKDFYTPFQTRLKNQTYTTPNEALSSIDIIATEDNTTITITPTVPLRKAGGGTYPAGVAFTVTLDAGQTYSAWAVDLNGADRPAGTHITSDKPIAVTIKDDSVIAGGWDMIGDQLTPVDYLGSQYIVMKGALDQRGVDAAATAPEYIYIVATQDGTTFTANGVAVAGGPFNKGTQVQIPVTSAYMKLESNSKPFYMLHVSGNGGEICGAVAPPTDQCSGSQRVGFTYRYGASGQGIYINLMVRVGAETNFLVDGAAAAWLTPASFTAVPGGVWSVARFGPLNASNLTVGAHTISNTKDLFHMGYINYTGPGAMYGYFSDFEILEPKAVAVKSNLDSVIVCQGEEIQLRVEGGFGYAWTGKNDVTNADVTSYLNSTTIYNPKVDGAIPIGNYTFTVKVTGACGAGIVATKNVKVKVKSAPTANDVSVQICETTIGSGCATAIDLTSYTNAITGGAAGSSIVKWEKDVFNQMLTLDDYDLERHFIYMGNNARSLNTSATNPGADSKNPDPTTTVMSFSINDKTGFIKMQPKTGYSFDLTDGNIFKMLVYNKVDQPWAHTGMTVFSKVTMRLLTATDSVDVTVNMSKFTKWEELTFDFGAVPQKTYSDLKIIFTAYDWQQDIFYVDNIRKEVAYQKVKVPDPSNADMCNPGKIYVRVSDVNECIVDALITPTIGQATYAVGNLTNYLVCETDSTKPGEATGFSLLGLTNTILTPAGVTAGRTIKKWDKLNATYDSILENFDNVKDLIIWNKPTLDASTSTVTLNETQANPKSSAINSSATCARIPASNCNLFKLTTDFDNPFNLSDGYIFKMKVCYDWSQDWQNDNGAKTVTMELLKAGVVVATSAAADVKVPTAGGKNIWKDVTFDFTAQKTLTGIDQIRFTFNQNAWSGVNWYFDNFVKVLSNYRAQTSTLTNLTVKDGDAFWAIVTDAGNCMKEVPITLDVVKCTVKAIDQTAAFCETTAGSGQKTAINLTTYDNAIKDNMSILTVAWYSNAALTTSVATPTNVTATNNQIFYAKVRNPNSGDQDTATLTFTINSLPTVNIADVTICNGASTSLTAPASMTTYAWSTSASTQSITVSPTATTSYTVTITDSKTCTNTDRAVVTVNALPTASISGTTTICAGSSTTLTASGATSYAWSGGGATATKTVTPVATTTYTVTATSNSCTDTETVTVTVNALPTAAITGTTPICAGSSSILTASGGTTYNWDNSTTLANRTVTPASTATYTVTATSNGCTDTETITITVNALPTAAIAGTTPICAGSSSILTASGGTTYNWDNSTTLANRTVTPASTATYTVTATSNGCTDTETITITVNPLPTAIITGTTTICAGSSTTLTVAGGSTYAWDDASTSATRAVTPASTTTYTVTATSLGCTDTEKITVTVNALPTAAIAGTTTICAGSSTTLTASGGTSYAWTGGGTTATNTVTPATTSTYSVTATSLGCTDTETITVTVNALPTAVITGTTTICAGVSTTLTVSGGSTYAWDDASTATERIVTPATTTTYTVTATSNACTDTEKITVTVNPLPTAVINGTKNICNGASTTLTAAGGTSYVWNDAATTTTKSVSPTATTTYTITATTLGCTDTETAIVTVNNLPTVNAGVDRAVCKTDAANLTAATTATVNAYLWSKNAATALTSTSTQATAGTLVNASISSDVTYTYTVSITDNNGCTATDDVSITYQAQCKPTIDLIAATPLCIGDTTTLKITITSQKPLSSATYNDGLGAVPLVYAGTGPTYTASKLLQPNTSTTYTIEATDITGSVGTGTIAITVNALPTITLTNKSTCLGTSATLTAVGGGTGAVYSWDEGTSGAMLSKSPTVTSTYIVSVADANGCTDTEQGVITINPVPTVSAGADFFICKTDAATLTATSSTATGYTWAKDAQTTLNATNIPIVDASLLVTTIAANAPHMYTVSVSDVNGCTASDDIQVTYQAQCIPVISITADPKSTLCLGEGTTLKTIVTSQKTLSAAQWIINGVSTNATFSGTAPTYIVDDMPISPTTTTTYTLKATDNTGSEGQSDIIITVNPLPSATVADVTVCPGNNINLTATGAGTGSYVWSPSGNSAIVTASNVLANTTYVVTVTDANGCSDTEDGVISLNAVPNVSAGTPMAGCKDNALTLSPTQDATWTYSWASSPASSIVTATSSTPSVSYLTPGTPATDVIVTYTVTVSDVNGCTNSDDVTITYEYSCRPYVYLKSDDTEICAGETTTVWAETSSQKSIATLTWSNNAFDPLPPHTPGVGPKHTITPNADVTYYITVTDVEGRSNTSEITISVNPLPIADAGTDKTICAGDNTTLAVSNTGANGIQQSVWLDNNTGLPFTNTSVAPAITTTYTALITDSKGCKDIDDVIVNVNQLPTPDAGVDQTICPETSTTLTATGGQTYAWSTGETSATINIAAETSTKTYKLTVYDSNNCQNTDEVIVNRHAAAQPDAGVNTSICLTQASATLTASNTSGAATYLWSNGKTTASIIESPATAGTYPYQVTATTTNGCTATDEVTLTVNALPTADLGNLKEICYRDQTTLSDVNASMKKYQWSNLTATTQQVNVSPLTTTLYTITITDNNNCTATDTVTVQVNPQPLVSVAALQDECISTASTLLSGGTPAGGTFFGNYVNSSTGTFSPSGATQGTHTISYRYTNNKGCSDTATQTIKVLPLPVVNMQDQSVCEGGSATLSAGPSSSQSYLWNDGSTLSSRIETPDTTTTYSVVASAGGCTAQGDVTITVHPIPTVHFTTNANAGCEPFTPTFSDSTSPAGKFFIWHFGDGSSDTTTSTSINHTYVNAGYYTIDYTVITVAGCSASVSEIDRIQVMQKPVADFNYTPQYPTNFDSEVTFTDLSIGAINDWYWDFNDPDSEEPIVKKEDSPTHTFNDTRTYKVKLIVTSANNCYDTIIKNVVVKADYTLFAPNSFTPNNDGINDYFTPVGVGIDPATFQLSIYSRWGEEIFSASTYNDPWDGRRLRRGEILPEGVYSWLCIFKDLEGTEYKLTGAVMLIY